MNCFTFGRKKLRFCLLLSADVPATAYYCPRTYLPRTITVRGRTCHGLILQEMAKLPTAQVLPYIPVCNNWWPSCVGTRYRTIPQLMTTLPSMQLLMAKLPTMPRLMVKFFSYWRLARHHIVHALQILFFNVILLFKIVTIDRLSNGINQILGCMCLCMYKQAPFLWKLVINLGAHNYNVAPCSYYVYNVLSPELFVQV